MPKTTADAIKRAVEACAMIIQTPEAFGPDLVKKAVMVLRQHAPEMVRLEVV